MLFLVGCLSILALFLQTQYITTRSNPYVPKHIISFHISALKHMQSQFLNSSDYPYINFLKHGNKLSTSPCFYKFIMMLHFLDHSYRDEKVLTKLTGRDYNFLIEPKIKTLQIYAKRMNVTLLNAMSEYMEISTLRNIAFFDELNGNDPKPQICKLSKKAYPQFLKWETYVLKEEDVWIDQYDFRPNKVIVALYYLSAFYKPIQSDFKSAHVLWLASRTPISILKQIFMPFYGPLKQALDACQNGPDGVWQNVRIDFSKAFKESIEVANDVFQYLFEKKDEKNKNLR